MIDEGSNLWVEESHGDQVILRIRLKGCEHAETTPFQRIEVFDSHAFGKILRLGNQLVLSDADAAIYSEGLVLPALASHPDPSRVLILGGGDGGVATAALEYPGVEQVTVVELDQQVVEASRRFFPRVHRGLNDERCSLIIDDAHRFLENATDSWDIIVIDGTELHNPASDAVQHHAFASLAAQHLAPGGILVAPLGSPVHQAERCREQLASATQVFSKCRVYLLNVPSLAGGNWCVAWCTANEELDPLDLQVEREAIGDTLTYWEPTLQKRLFTLPKPTRNSLGLD